MKNYEKRKKGKKPRLFTVFIQIVLKEKYCLKGVYERVLGEPVPLYLDLLIFYYERMEIIFLVCIG